MGIIELLLIAVGLSMDAFAVSVCKGLSMPRIKYNQVFIIALFFGGFQALMPIIGWSLGSRFEKYITSVDHWIAFVLLAFIGVKMVIEALKSNDDEELADNFSIKEIFIMAVATSIDALAVGITFAFLNVEIISSAAIIGIITLVISFAGVMIGHRFGARFKSSAELLGGIILVLIGVKILLEHLSVIAF